MTISLRPYQRRCLDQLYAYFERKQGMPLLVLPTGAGKSILIGAFCAEVLARYPNERLLVVSHVRELLEQNAEKVRLCAPHADTGFYCAALGRKKPRAQVVVASVQSAAEKAHEIGWRSLVLIDEAHLLSPSDTTRYQKLLAGLKRINPKLKVIGFTATPYRLDSGLLTEGDGSLFTDVAAEVSIRELLDGGFVAPLVGKSSAIQADLSRVRLTAGEFNQADAEAAMDTEELTEAMLEEVLSLAEGRRSWLFFCAGVKHARHVCEALRNKGIAAACLTGDTPAPARAEMLADFKSGKLRALTSVQTVTTGFDAPGVDLIVVLRPTVSPSLHVQMLGRGMRTAPGKENCLVLDYCGNVIRHGPVTHVKPPRPPRKGQRRKAEEPQGRPCPECRSVMAVGTRECADCGHVFERQGWSHEAEAVAADPMFAAPAKAEPEWQSVTWVSYARHEKPGKPPSLRVDYRCGAARYSEWVCLEHTGIPQFRAKTWWQARGPLPVPESVAAALAEAGQLITPRRIRTQADGKYWRITDYDFTPTEEITAPAGACNAA